MRVPKNNYIDFLFSLNLGIVFLEVEVLHVIYIRFVYFCRKPWLHFDRIYYLTKAGKEYKSLCNYIHAFSDRIIEDRKQNLVSSIYYCVFHYKISILFFLDMTVLFRNIVCMFCFIVCIYMHILMLDLKAH